MDNNDNDDPSMITIDSSDDDDGDGDISKRESGGIDLVANQVVSEEMDDDDDVDVSVDDPYLSVAASEFTASHIKLDNNPTTTTTTSDLVRRSGEFPNDEDDMSITTMDWGGALGKLRQRLDDMEQGKSGNPSQALFRLMSSQSPNQAIGSFVTSANPHVVQAMSGAVSSLLGGLSSPTSGVETLVKATGEKLGSLCFQLQMTG